MSDRPLLLAALAYVALTLAVFRLSPEEMSRTVPTLAGNPSDSILYVFELSHVSRSLLERPLDVFDAGIFHPAPYTLAYSDHMIGQALAGLPVWLAARNPVLELNVLVLASFALGALALFAYARAHLGHALAAFAAGAAFAFTPFRFDVLSWVQVLFTPLMPLAVWLWVRFTERRSRRDLLLWVAAWAGQCLMGMYVALLFSLVMGGLILYGLVAAPGRADRRLWLGSLLAPVAVLLLIAPTLWPYVYQRMYLGVERSFLDWPFLELMLPGLGSLSGELLGLDSPFRRGPGAAVSLLALAGIAAGWVRARAAGPEARFRYGAHLLGLGLSLGLCALPLRLLQDIPGLDTLRTNNRALAVALLFIALFAGESVAWLARLRIRGAGLAALLATVAVLVDMGAPRYERVRLPPEDRIPPVYRWLEQHAASGGLWERGAPGRRHFQAMSMYYATFHELPLLGGYSGFVSPAWKYAAWRLRDFPSPDTVELLRDMDARWVVWHVATPAGLDPFLERVDPLRPSLRVAARFDTAAVLELRSGGEAAVGDPSPAASSRPVAPLPASEHRFSAARGPDGLERLLDGRRSTVWSVRTRKGDGAPAHRNDQGGPYPVAGKRCAPAASDAPGIYRSKIEVSRDGRQWTPVPARFEPDSLETLIQRPAHLDFFQAVFPPVPARYVRLVNPSLTTKISRHAGERFELAEVRVLVDCESGSAPGCR